MARNETVEYAIKVDGNSDLPHYEQEILSRLTHPTGSSYALLLYPR
ncbi:5857_t:CDS:1, partial [Ambispora leptoticha]